MDTQQADPSITLALSQGLTTWSLSSHGNSDDSLPSTRLAIAQQSDIGWHLLLEGWAAIDWEVLQNN
jgi:hypothetical protein